MSADRQALLDAIRDDPDDASVRLIYADWLEDHGEPQRAEYIRLCHELCALPAADPRAARLERLRKQLFRAHGKHWAAGLAGPVARALQRHGLVLHVESTAAAFLKSAGALREEPVARVTLTRAGRQVKKLVGSGALGRVRELALDGHLDGAAVQALADWPGLAGLRALRLIGCGIDATTAQTLAASPHLANLRTLDLGNYLRHDDDPNNSHWRNVGTYRTTSGGGTNHLGDDGFAALAGSPHLSGLETLIVSNNWISPDGARELWARGRFPKLRRLDMSYNYLGPGGLRELVASPLMRRLELLEVQANEVGSEGTVALAGSASARGLKLLDLSGTPVLDDRPRLTNAAAEALANSPHLGGLEHLVLTYTNIGAKGAAALAKSGRLRSLRSLYLSNGRLGNGGARALASSPLLGRLERLAVGANGVTAEGALAFARSKTAGERLALDLGGNFLDEGTVAALRQRFGVRLSYTGPSFEDEETDGDME